MWKEKLAAIPYKDLPKHRKYGLDLLDKGVHYDIVIIDEIKNLQELHEYLVAYYEYIGWQPWEKDSDLVFFEDDSVEGGRQKRAVDDRNMQGALQAGRMVAHRPDRTKKLLEECIKKYT